MSGLNFQLGTYLAADGSTIVVDQAGIHWVPAPATDPEPVPSPVPGGANLVRVGAATYPLAAVDPTAASNPAGAGYPGFRGPDQLVAYTSGTSPANRYGTEATVAGGKVVAVVDRTVTGLGGVVVPSGGAALSGHGAAAAFLRRYAVPGAAVSFETTTTPTPDPDPTPAPAGGATIALFRKDGSGSTSTIPAGVTDFLYSFLQGTSLVEWGGETVDTQRTNLGRWLDGDATRRLCIAVGGAKGTAATGNRGAFLGGFLAAEEKLGGRGGGIVWDIEGAAMVPDDVVAISTSLAAGRVDRFVVGFSPPGGSPVQVYLKAALACHRAGLRVWFGQQLYEGNKAISLDDALRALAVPIDAGLPADRVLLGTMVGSDWKHWTITQCVAVARAARVKWPTFGGAYLWSEGQEAQDAEWARVMAGMLT